MMVIAIVIIIGIIMILMVILLYFGRHLIQLSTSALQVGELENQMKSKEVKDDEKIKCQCCFLMTGKNRSIRRAVE